MDDGDADGGGDGAARRHVREAGRGERLASRSVDSGGGEPVVDVELDAVHDGNGEQAGGKAAVKSSGTALL